MDVFDRVDVMGTTEKPGVIMSRELRRILALPRRRLDLSKIHDLTSYFRHTARCREPLCDLCGNGRRDAALFPIQSAALWEASRRGGLLGPMPVGSGKTLTMLLLVWALRAQRAVLLVPPHTYTQVVEVDVPRYARHFHLPLDRAHLISHGQLSSQKNAGILSNIKPDAIIVDEAHALKDGTAARTKRFLAYMKKENPACMFVALSGTLTSTSIKDYAHLSELALRSYSPVPNRWGDLDEWSTALDADVEQPMAPGALMELALCEHCGERADRIIRKDEDALEELVCGACADGRIFSVVSTEPRRVARAAFRNRLLETEGVIGTSDSGCEASIIIQGVQLETPQRVKDALKELERTWCVGDDELEDATAYWRAARQLSLGFYLRWAWPNDVPDDEWLEARRGWHGAVRAFLQHASRPGLDSEGLVRTAVERGHLSSPRLVAAWRVWDRVRLRPAPPTEAVWLDDFAVRAAAMWAQKFPGVVYYENIEFGDALERLAGHVLPIFRAGMDAEILDFIARREAGDMDAFSCAASFAHTEGKNMQRAWHRALVVSPPAGGKLWEQLIGRFHRPGQTADEILIDVFSHTAPLRAAVFGAREDARYVQETMKTRQKLCAARIMLDANSR